MAKGGFHEEFRKHDGRSKEGGSYPGADRPTGGLSERAKHQPNTFDEVRDPADRKEELPTQRRIEKGD